MEIKKCDYVKYKGKVYSVAFAYFNSSGGDTFDLISYKDLEILKKIPRSELERLTDFHVSVMRYNKTLPKRRFKVGDRVKIRADLDSDSICGGRFYYLGFNQSDSYVVSNMHSLCLLGFSGLGIHEFEVELVEGN